MSILKIILLTFLIPFKISASEDKKIFSLELVNSAISKNWTLLRSLLESNTLDVNSTDGLNSTALHWAAAYGKDNFVVLLLSKGAAVNSSDSLGNTPLLEAASHGHLNAVQLLIGSGACLNQTNNAGWSAFMLAAYHGHLDIVKYFVESHRIDIEQEDNYVRGTAVIHAVAWNYLEVVEYLISKGADLSHETLDGETAFSMAKKTKNPHMIRLLKFHNAL